jgi:hypothetical protein
MGPRRASNPLGHHGRIGIGIGIEVRWEAEHSKAIAIPIAMGCRRASHLASHRGTESKRPARIARGA